VGKTANRVVFDQWPRKNNSNTIIIDQKLERVDCNRGTNVIVTRPFYVVDIEKLGDDMLHLKSLVWPMLEKFSLSEDVQKFRKKYRRDMAEAGITLTQLIETKAELDMAGAIQGEGTYEPGGSYCSLSLWEHGF
jgi:hypothetical protein